MYLSSFDSFDDDDDDDCDAFRMPAILVSAAQSGMLDAISRKTYD